MSTEGAVLPRRITGRSLKDQNKIKRAIRYAKHMGYFEYKNGNFTWTDPYTSATENDQYIGEISPGGDLEATFGGEGNANVTSGMAGDMASGEDGETSEEGLEEEPQQRVEDIRDIDDEWIEDTTGLWEKIQAGQQVRPPKSTPAAEIAKPSAVKPGAAKQTEEEKEAPKPRNYDTWEFNFRK